MNTRNKILIVDDDPTILDLFQLMLSKLGFVVEEATDGLDALEKMKKFHPDLILLDNIMPEMNGWEFTKRIKEDKRYMNIPIIMFSSLDEVKDKVAGLEIGADDYITKPFNFIEVLARIRAVLRARVREARLNLAEGLNTDMRQNLSDLGKGIDDLDVSVAEMSSWLDASGTGVPARLIGDILDRTEKIHGLIENLNSRIGKTVSEWDDLKKNEIGLSSLESEARKFLQQEQKE